MKPSRQLSKFAKAREFAGAAAHFHIAPPPPGPPPPPDDFSDDDSTIAAADEAQEAAVVDPEVCFMRVPAFAKRCLFLLINFNPAPAGAFILSLSVQQKKMYSSCAQTVACACEPAANNRESCRQWQIASLVRQQVLLA